MGASWVDLGVSWGGLRAILSNLGDFLEQSWKVLGWSWGHFKRSWELLGASREVLSGLTVFFRSISFSVGTMHSISIIDLITVFEQLLSLQTLTFKQFVKGF